MKTIIINSPKYGIKEVFVDDEDYPFLIQYKWYIRKTKHTFYAQRWTKMENGEREKLYMHRVILNIKDPSVFGDHEDHNGLNNQKYNIRPCSKAQNGYNRMPLKGTASKYLGVRLNIDKRNKKEYKYWLVNFMIDGKAKHVGNFPYTDDGEIQAAKRYDEFAKKYYGEFANLNFK